MKPNYKKLLYEKREKKFEILKDKEVDEYECNHSEGDRCAACTHPGWCIFSEERIEYEKNLAKIKFEQKDLQQYLQKGEGTREFNKISIMAKLLNLKKELRKLNESKDRFKRNR